MLKISKLTDYGTLVMGGLAERGNELVSTAELAEAIGVAQPTVAKLLKMFTRAGLVESLRGQQGGYRLGVAPEQISVAEIIQAVAQAYTDLGNDDGLRVGVVFGHGEHFMAGLDLMDVALRLAGGDPAAVLPLS